MHILQKGTKLLIVTNTTSKVEYQTNKIHGKYNIPLSHCKVDWRTNRNKLPLSSSQKSQKITGFGKHILLYITKATVILIRSSKVSELEKERK